MSSNFSPSHRTKSFTGCWTCRSRRVKCDEHQPYCNRCTQSGFPCQGYAVRLAWTKGRGGSSDKGTGDQDGPSASASSRPARRLMPTGTVRDITSHQQPECTSPPKLDAIFKKMDSSSYDDDRSVVNGGLFSVFSIDSSFRNRDDDRSMTMTAQSPSNSGASPAGTPCTLDTFLNDSTSESQTPSTSLFSDVVSKETGSRFWEDQLPTTELEAFASADLPGFCDDPADELFHYSCQDTTALATRDFTGGSYMEPHTTENEQRKQQVLDDDRALNINHHRIGSHLDLLSMPVRQKRLIHHYVTFLSSKLLLIDEPHNPCRTKILPMALRGLVSSSRQSSAEIAIFHAICACSAYNIFELSGRVCEEDHTLAIRHDQLAMTHLRHSVASNDESDASAIGMAIMTCLAVEATSAIPRRWRTHIAGGLNFLSNLRSRKVQSDDILQFKQSLVCLAILTGFDVPEDVAACLEDSHSLEQLCSCHGLPASFARTIATINRIITSERTYSQKELDSFELQLYLNFPKMRQGCSMHHNTVLYHMDKAFYYAGLVFFQRTVQHTPLEEVQRLVQQGLEELEAIEEITNGLSGCVIMWPSLVLAADCITTNLQSRASAWFKQKEKLGFRNVTVLRRVASTVWSIRSSAKVPSDVTWQDVVKKEDLDVFRL